MLNENVNFDKEPEAVVIMPLPDGMADVWLRRGIGTTEASEGESEEAASVQYFAQEEAYARLNAGEVSRDEVINDFAMWFNRIAEWELSIPSSPETVDDGVALEVQEIAKAVTQTATLLALVRPVAAVVAAEKYSDEQLMASADLFDKWQPLTYYPAGTILRHGADNLLYRVLTAHTSQAHQQPDSAGMLAVYAPIQEPAADGKVLPWVYGETGLQVGDKRECGGVVYEAIQAPGANVWDPSTVPAIWKAVA